MSKIVAIKVLPNVWLGDAKTAEYKKFFEKEHIEAVLNVTPSVPNFFVYDTSIEYLRVPIYDSEKKRDQIKTFEYFPVMTEFIYKNVILEKKNILIHCHLGQQRSCTAVAAYLIKCYKMSPTDSVKYIHDRKPDSFNFNKHVNFSKSLNKWYRKIKEE
jgi:protein-tyrosine phosphatase